MSDQTIQPGSVPSRRSAARGAREPGAYFLGLFAITFVVFHSTLSAGFLFWDDNLLITENPHFGGLTLRRLAWMFTDFQFVWRYVPLSWLGWFLTFNLFGLNPFGYHLGNLILHSLNAGLLFLSLRRLLIRGCGGQTASVSASYLNWCAALGAAWWAWHPLRVEPVAWISARFYDQALFFILLSLLLYLRWLETGPSTKHRWTYWGSVGGFAASLLSFPIGLGWLAVLVVLDFFPRRQFNSGPGWWKDLTARRILRDKIPFIAVTGLVVLTTSIARFNANGLSAGMAGWADFSLAARVAQGAYIWSYFLWKPWMPLDLAPVYSTLIDFSPMDPPFVASLAAVLLISIFLVWQRRQWPLPLALWICHLAVLVPVLGLTEHPHYPSDRYSLLSSLGWSVFLAAGLWTLRHRPTARLGAAGLVLAGMAVLSTLSFRQAGVWHNDSVFFQHLIDKLADSPARADAYWRKGCKHWDTGERDQAWTCFREALRLYPNSPIYRRSRGRLNLEMGRAREAVEDMRVVLRKKPNLDDVRLLGAALAQQGELSEAAAQFEEALRQDPQDAQTHFILARVRENQKQFASAMTHYRTALEYRSNWPEAMANLARVLVASPTPDQASLSEAVQLAEQACRLTRFQQPQFLPVLADAYAAAGRWDQAIATAEQAALKAEALGLTNMAKGFLMQLEGFRKRQPNQTPER
jgi:tetratricopeptide (TPR) repeat protein